MLAGKDPGALSGVEVDEVLERMRTDSGGAVAYEDFAEAVESKRRGWKNPWLTTAKGKARARIHAETGHPHEIVAADDERQPVALPRRHAGFLEKVFQRASRPLRVALQPLAARAQPHAQRFSARIDALPLHAAKSQLAAELGDAQPRLAVPRHWCKGRYCLI